MVEQEENVTAIDDDDSATGALGPKRVQSNIEFPYADLEVASQLAVELHRNAGNQADDAELAAWLDQSPTGGTYRARRSAARMFGLIEITQGKVALTPLGRDLADEAKAKTARGDAFLRPALYGQMYEKCRGTVLPPPTAIERMMVNMGVSPKQKERARQAFQKSAIHAGFIDANTGRFVKPGNGVSQAEIQPIMQAPNGEHGGSGAGGEGGDLELDRLLMELLRKIPSKEDGWPASKRVRWFRTFAMNVSQVYDDDDEPIELEITLPKESESRSAT
jgi:hypothetical protein